MLDGLTASVKVEEPETRSLENNGKDQLNLRFFILVGGIREPRLAASVSVVREPKMAADGRRRPHPTQREETGRAVLPVGNSHRDQSHPL